MQKNYLVVGLARSGIAAVLYLDKNNHNVWVYDAKRGLAKELIKSKILPPRVIPITKLSKKVAKNLSAIVISPGVLPDFWIELGAKYNIPVISELELSFRNCNCDVLAITGTNGKTTATLMLNKILNDAGKKTHCVGNIGNAFCAELDKIDYDDVAVCEVSSFQLEHIEKFKPKVVGFLNIAPDHLDRYKTMENYVSAKRKIFTNLDQNCYAVLNIDDPVVRIMGNSHFNCLYFGKKLPPKTDGAYFKDKKIFFVENSKKAGSVDLSKCTFVGKHNIYNAMCACLMARIYGVSFTSMQNSLQEFKTPEHRLEFVGNIGTIKFYNDSKATNITSCLTALTAFEDNVFLLMGGSDKGENFAEFFKHMPQCVKQIFVFGATARKIFHHAHLAGFENITRCENLEEAFDLAVKNSHDGTTILLSPACASFDQFVNYEQRGDFFKFLVKELQK